ncbi:hypothetical protein PIB30_054900 [Stylosanthes scabra]|uniref:Uncharacterized protein n=1 Tax=Stylosanthes scabra TaxID=79078 RepID=A0ABU6SKL1_9FABA|nr:hypothetical protein [Stylosanthes scabra]
MDFDPFQFCSVVMSCGVGETEINSWNKHSRKVLVIQVGTSLFISFCVMHKFLIHFFMYFAISMFICPYDSGEQVLYSLCTIVLCSSSSLTLLLLSFSAYRIESSSSGCEKNSNYC